MSFVTEVMYSLVDLPYLHVILDWPRQPKIVTDAILAGFQLSSFK